MTDETEHQAQRDIVNDAVAGSKDRRGRTILTLALLAMLIFTGVAAAGSYISYTTIQGAAQRGTTLAEQVQEACNDPLVDQTELGTLCDNADEVIEEAPEAAKGPKGDTGATGATGDPGVPGEQGPPPSPAQIANAVASYCANGRCDGADGRDGRNVTPSQVAEAVALYCNDRGQCKGPEGPPGTKGDQGSEGPKGDQGEVGPPPTDGQVLAAVTSYCSTRDNCQGPRGETGASGQDGQDGADSTVPGPAGQDGVDGQSAFPFNFTFTIPAEPPLQAERSYSCTVSAPNTTANCTSV